MEQQEYDAFRERMKQWMLDNADAYDEFEEMMNSQKYGKDISKSINLGLRTRQDWEEYNNFRKVNKVLFLKNMILLNDEKKKMLLDKIEEYINTGVKGKRIAFMILALRQTALYCHKDTIQFT